MDLKASPFRSLLKIAELGSFTKAAEVLHVSQPALSASIREMERQLGFDVFSRTSRRVELTHQGQALLANVRRVVLESDWLHQRAEEIRTNALRIAVQPHSVFYPDRTRLTDAYLQTFPDTEVKVLTLGHVRIYEALLEDEIDVAIVVEAEDGQSTASIREEDVERLVIGIRPVRLLVPGRSPLNSSRAIRLEDLAGQQIATINRLHGVALADTVARRLVEVGAELVRPPEADMFSLIRFAWQNQCVCVDFGWFNTDRYAPAMSPGSASEMVLRPAPCLALSTRMSILRKRREPREAARAFWAFAQHYICHLPKTVD